MGREIDGVQVEGKDGSFLHIYGEHLVSLIRRLQTWPFRHYRLTKLDTCWTVRSPFVTMGKEIGSLNAKEGALVTLSTVL
jgi:hypothetical protein